MGYYKTIQNFATGIGTIVTAMFLPMMGFSATFALGQSTPDDALCEGKTRVENRVCKGIFVRWKWGGETTVNISFRFGEKKSVEKHVIFLDIYFRKVKNVSIRYFFKSLFMAHLRYK